jgi:transcriptional regulator with XRE-family HTH domain
MSNTDIELIEELRGLAGGTQQLLADALEVTPSAISNWVSAKRVPEGSRTRLLRLRERLQNSGDQPDSSFSHSEAPERLRPDTDCCGFWAKSAWSFHYLCDTDDSNTAVDDEIWRTWNSVRVSHHTTFRHHTRFKPAGNWSAQIDEERDRFGIGFLKDWKPKEWKAADSNETQVYMTASADLAPGPPTSGGYFVRARKSVARWASTAHAYEFVTFKPECPVETAHLVLSIPRSILGNGPKLAYRVALEYSQFYDIAAAVQSDSGELDRLIEPWGRVLPVQRMRPEVIPGCDRKDGHHWADDWNGDEGLGKELAAKFAPSADRETYIVSDDSPIALGTLLLFWPMPTADSGARR